MAKGGKQEKPKWKRNGSKWNEARQVHDRHADPPTTPWPPRTHTASRQLNMATFLLVWSWQLVAAHNQRTCQAFSLVNCHGLQQSRVCLSVCVCFWPYTCSCRTLTSRNSRKIQSCSADQTTHPAPPTQPPSSSSLHFVHTCSRQGAATWLTSSFCLPAGLPAIRLDNHVEYLALTSPHLTSIFFPLYKQTWQLSNTFF